MINVGRQIEYALGKQARRNAWDNRHNGNENIPGVVDLRGVNDWQGNQDMDVPFQNANFWGNALAGGRNGPTMFGNVNQLYEQMTAPRYVGYGYNPYDQQAQAMAGPWGMISQGVNTMNNLGNQIGGSFALANALSSANMQAKYPAMAQAMAAETQGKALVEAERMRQEGQTARLRDLGPLLQGILGQGATLGSISTNYGAGVNTAQGSAAKPTNVQDFRAGIKRPYPQMQPQYPPAQ